ALLIPLPWDGLKNWLAVTVSVHLYGLAIVFHWATAVSTSFGDWLNSWHNNKQAVPICWASPKVNHCNINWLYPLMGIGGAFNKENTFHCSCGGVGKLSNGTLASSPMAYARFIVPPSPL